MKDFEYREIKDENGIRIIAYYGYNIKLVIPNEIDGKKVVSIGYKAFYKHNLINVIIPDSVRNIGNRAFAYNKLKSLTIPNGIINIGIGAFSYNQLTSITIKRKNLCLISSDTFYANYSLKTVYYPRGINYPKLWGKVTGLDDIQWVELDSLNVKSNRKLLLRK